jgi:MFS family permease
MGDEPRPTRLPRTFTALRHHNFRLFWFGQLISLIGTWMQSIAQSWLVLDLTKSAFQLGLTSALGMLPVLVLSLPAGAIADRVNKRNLLIVTQSAMMLLAFVLAGLAMLRVLQVWHIYVLATLLGVCNAFDMPGRQSFVIELVGRDDLLNAVALNSTAFNSARIIGPAIAGILIGTIGPAGCFFINGASFLAVIAGLALMKTEAPNRSNRENSILDDMLEGLRHVGQDKEILTIVCMVGVFSVFGMPYTVLMPVFAKSVLQAGARGYSLLMTCTGVGAVAGAAMLATFSNIKRRGRLMLANSIAFVVVIVLFAASRSLALSAALLVVVGFTMVNQAAMANTILQVLAPDDLRGRVMAVFGIMFLGFAPFGSLQAGTIAEKLGAPSALVIGSAVMAVTIACVLIFRPELREL